VITSPDPPRDATPYPAEALAGPFRAILAAVILGSCAVQAVDLVTGQYARGMLIAAIAGVGLIAWRVAARGAIDAAAMVLFGFIVVAITTRMWVGNGLRDFGIAAYPAVLFLGCLFLRTRAYWALSAMVLAGALAVGLGDVLGWRAGTGIPVRAGNLANLMIILVVCAAGGRALMSAVREGYARERALSGALAVSQERMDRIFRATQNAIVVSRVEDGLYHDVNDAYLHMFGYERHEVVGRSSLALGIWEDPRERERFVRDASRRGGARGFDTRLRRRSGEIFEAQLSAERLAIDGTEYLVVSVADVSAQRVAQRRAEHLATRDPLTGMPNRMLALDRLERAMEHARRHGGCVGVLHLGIDRFGAVNESLGRDRGDELLRQAAARVEAMLLPGDSLARLGGDELLYIAASLGTPERAEGVAKKLAGVFERPFSAGGQNVHLTCSVGVSTFPQDAADAELLLGHAESALRAAKAEGRGRCCLFDRVMVEQVRDRLMVQDGLRAAIAGGKLRLHYQPKFSLGDGKVTGFEALARWSHPELGPVSPARFVAIAEESDLIFDLGAWAMNEACAQLARWRAEGRVPLPVAINLSARQLRPALPGEVAERTAIHGLDPALLELEVTESMLITRPEATRQLLQQVAARGSGIVLDDFGVGYSSLGYLKHLPLNGIKVDRTFVEGVAADPCDVAIVRAMVDLAHGLGIRVIAEGIEHEAQLEAVRAMGCDEGQGYLLARPEPAEEASRRLRAAVPAVPVTD
jgi:diguanylate cyclase (GGDEF)-like protein/PAS domain S-box-containing protein